jgi:dynein heavy chain, axonemal
VKAIVDEFNSRRKAIMKNIAELSELPLVKIESKRLYDDVAFESAQAEHRKRIGDKLERLHSEIRVTLADLCKLFAGDSQESAKELDKFIMFADGKVQESLSMALRRSLQELSRAINGDKRTEPQRIFRVQVFARYSNSVEFWTRAHKILTSMFEF